MFKKDYKMIQTLKKYALKVVALTEKEVGVLKVPVYVVTGIIALILSSIRFGFGSMESSWSLLILTLFFVAEYLFTKKELKEAKQEIEVLKAVISV